MSDLSRHPLPFPGIAWTNRDRVTVINRSTGVTVNWSGGSQDTVVLIGGVGTDQKTKAMAGFFCLSPNSGSFSVPPSVMSNLPATGAPSLQDSFGTLALVSLPTNLLMNTFSASGIDKGYILPVSLDLRSVEIR